MAELFEATRIRGMTLRNRVVRSATHEGMADEDGVPGPALAHLYTRLARGEVGLIITGYAYVARDGKSPFPGMLGIDRDDLIPHYRKLVDEVHPTKEAVFKAAADWILAHPGAKAPWDEKSVKFPAPVPGTTDFHSTRQSEHLSVP